MHAEPKLIWRRRVLLMFAVALAVGIPLTIALRGDDDGKRKPATPNFDPPALGELKFERRLGVELRLPEGWTKSAESDVLQLRSPSRRVGLSIAAPALRDSAPAVLDDAVATLKRQYRDVRKISRARKQAVGGLEGNGFAFTARAPKAKTPLFVLVLTARGRRLAYLVELFVTGASPTQALEDGGTALRFVRLRG